MNHCMNMRIRKCRTTSALIAEVGLLCPTEDALAADRTNIVMLITDDTGWNDFGAYSGGGAGLGHPTRNLVTGVSLLRMADD